MGKNKDKVKASEKLDLSSYACNVMIFGAVSGHGITREMVENLCIRYSDEHPRVDITKMPVVMARDDGKAVNKALLSLIKEYCADCATVSEDGNAALMVGLSAKEVVASLRPKFANAHRLRTKYRIECPISLNRKFKCFNGMSVGERLKELGLKA